MITDDDVVLPGGPRLALRRAAGAGRPFLLVHGLASNARLWDGVSARLAEAGHEVAAVDLRGHGRLEQTTDGYDTATAADDLAALIPRARLGRAAVAGRGRPVVGRQRRAHPRRAARRQCRRSRSSTEAGSTSADRFPTFEECWERTSSRRTSTGGPAPSSSERARDWNSDWPAGGTPGRPRQLRRPSPTAR